MTKRDPRPTFQRLEVLAQLLEVDLPKFAEPEARAAWARILEHATAMHQELDSLEDHLREYFAADGEELGEELGPVEITTAAIEATTVRIVMERPEWLRAWLRVLFASPTMSALMADLTFPTARELRTLEESFNVARVLVADCRQKKTTGVSIMMSPSRARPLPQLPAAPPSEAASLPTDAREASAAGPG